MYKRTVANSGPLRWGISSMVVDRGTNTTVSSMSGGTPLQWCRSTQWAAPRAAPPVYFYADASDRMGAQQPVMLKYVLWMVTVTLSNCPELHTAW